MRHVCTSSKESGTKFEIIAIQINQKKRPLTAVRWFLVGLLTKTSRFTVTNKHIHPSARSYIVLMTLFMYNANCNIFILLM